MTPRRLYESTFIINAALEDNDVDAVIARVHEYVTNHGGQILETNKWGRRRLAYPIKKKYNGFYVHCVFEAQPSILPLLERFFVLEENVLRHLSLQLSPKLREFRASREVNYMASEPGREPRGNRGDRNNNNQQQQQQQQAAQAAETATAEAGAESKTEGNSAE